MNPQENPFSLNHVPSESNSLSVRPTSREAAGQRELIVSDTASIRAIARQISIWRVERRTLSVRFPALDDEANATLRSRMSTYFGACGCHQGRIAGVATLIGYLVLVVTGVISVRALGLQRVVLAYFLVSFVVMFIGKLIGLSNARRGLQALADDLDATHGAFAQQRGD